MSQFLPYLLAGLALVLVVSVWLAYRRNRNWRLFAMKYRFNYSQGKWMQNPVVYGEIQGRSFRLSKGKQSSDTGLMGVEMVEMSMGILGWSPAGLEISKSLKTLADQDSSSRMKTGDEQFDRAAVVKGEEAAEVAKYLNPERRKAILELLTHKSADWAGVRGDRAVLVERRMVSSLGDVERRFQFLFDLTKRLDG